MKTKIFIPMVCFLAGALATWYFMPKPASKNTNTETTRTITRTRTVKVPGKETTETIIIDTGKKHTVEVKAQKQWNAYVGVHTGFDGLKPDYSITVNRRVLGQIFVGANARTDGSLGLNIGMEF